VSKKYERRISDLIRAHVCELIEREIRDPRVEGVTVTDIELTPDTRYATVYWSVIGDKTRQEDVQRGLSSAAGWVSRELGKRLRTKNTPHITFEHDVSLERGDRMSQLLDELKASEAERTQSDPPPNDQS
jgi:ribosome-binding factor A